MTVPEAWTEAVDTERWTPPDADVDESSISAGTEVGWNENDDPGEGVFLGLLPGEALPTTVPQHPECEVAAAGRERQPRRRRLHDRGVQRLRRGGITIERIVQVNANRLLWVQVRAADRATANDVLDSVRRCRAVRRLSRRPSRG